MASFGPYPAVVLDVHDGDTMRLQIDLGFSVSFVYSCRVFGINAPELATAAGKTARDFAQQLVPVGTALRVVSHGWDKFGGRFDGELTLPDGRSFAAVMLAAGMAVPFMV